MQNATIESPELLQVEVRDKEHLDAVTGIYQHKLRMLHREMQNVAAEMLDDGWHQVNANTWQYWKGLRCRRALGRVGAGLWAVYGEETGTLDEAKAMVEAFVAREEAKAKVTAFVAGEEARFKTKLAS